MTLQIACGDSQCTLLPLAGGGLAGWSVGGQEMLRTALEANDPLKSASFPLVPFSNRIADARFVWNGQQINLVSDALSPPHAIHGIGWKRPWEVKDAGTDFASMTLLHRPDAYWPWSYEAEQKFTIDETSLTVELSARNLADIAVPLAFGHHPYFKSAGAKLAFEAAGFLASGQCSLPGELCAIEPVHDFADGLAVSDIEIDNLYTGWSGEAEISWAESEWALRIISDLPHAVVFTPSGADFFCFEPVPHLTNALNRPDGDMPIIGAGEVYSARICFEAFRED